MREAWTPHTRQAPGVHRRRGGLQRNEVLQDWRHAVLPKEQVLVCLSCQLRAWTRSHLNVQRVLGVHGPGSSYDGCRTLGLSAVRPWRGGLSLQEVLRRGWSPVLQPEFRLRAVQALLHKRREGHALRPPMGVRRDRRTHSSLREPQGFPRRHGGRLGPQAVLSCWGELHGEQVLLRGGRQVREEGRKLGRLPCQLRPDS
mmetsp:Transcript_36536/g.77754  ORF Transcript_36536/g.77754 Transcript_36536/m.77754 type:complete len:200 (+) Transcript_36536:549-1148(+)